MVRTRAMIQAGILSPSVVRRKSSSRSSSSPRSLSSILNSVSSVHTPVKRRRRQSRRERSSPSSYRRRMKKSVCRGLASPVCASNHNCLNTKQTHKRKSYCRKKHWTRRVHFNI